MVVVAQNDYDYNVTLVNGVGSSGFFEQYLQASRKKPGGTGGCMVSIKQNNAAQRRPVRGAVFAWAAGTEAMISGRASG